MKHISDVKLSLVMLALLLLSCGNELFAFSWKPKLPVVIYDEGWNWDKRAYYLPTNWTADVPCARFYEKWTDNPKDGKHCLKFEYNTKIYHIFNWVMLSWVFPAYNWANIDGGLDLSEAKRITFWARGEKGGEYVVFGFGGNYGVFSDTTEMVFGPIKLSDKWEKYTLPLDGEDLSHISQGFSVIIRLDDNPEAEKNKRAITIYLDDAKIE